MFDKTEGRFVVDTEMAASIITDLQEILYYDHRRNALDPRKPVTPTMINKLRKVMRLAELAPRRIMVYDKDVIGGVEIDLEG